MVSYKKNYRTVVTVKKNKWRKISNRKKDHEKTCIKHVQWKNISRQKTTTNTVYVRTTPNPIPNEHQVTQSLKHNKTIKSKREHPLAGRWMGTSGYFNGAEHTPAIILAASLSGSRDEWELETAQVFPLSDFTRLVLNTSLSPPAPGSEHLHFRPVGSLRTGVLPWAHGPVPTCLLLAAGPRGRHEPWWASRHFPPRWDMLPGWARMLPLEYAPEFPTAHLILLFPPRRAPRPSTLNVSKGLSLCPSPLTTSHPLSWPTTALAWGHALPLSTWSQVRVEWPLTLPGTVGPQIFKWRKKVHLRQHCHGN